MIHRTLLALAAALAVPASSALLAPQDSAPPQGGQDEGGLAGRDVFGRIRKLKAGERHPMMGGWQLLDVEAEGYPREGLNASGMLLVTEGFLSFEMHAYWDEHQMAQEEVEGFQTFTAEYLLEAGERLICRTLIGAYMDEEDDELVWEVSGYPREFTVDVEGQLLKLTWGNGNVMTFGRRIPNQQARNDIFGKPQPAPKVDYGADIFGRRNRGGDDDDDQR